jgi:hypothetical protein
MGGSRGSCGIGDAAGVFFSLGSANSGRIVSRMLESQLDAHSHRQTSRTTFCHPLI